MKLDVLHFYKDSNYFQLNKN